jgi:hypothetical protein
MHNIGLYPANNNKLTFLIPAIKMMFGIIDRYINDYSSPGKVDVPYHYNERATLSIFAGAIWLADPSNLVLEEFRTEKKWTESCYKGRQDLWFRASGVECYGEVKQLWIPFNRVLIPQTGKILARLRKEADAAHQNLPAPSSPTSGAIAIGILFLVPYVLKRHIGRARDNFNKQKDDLQAVLNSWCEAEKAQVLWGQICRQELLEEQGCYAWSDGQMGSCPSLDVLICTR